MARPSLLSDIVLNELLLDLPDWTLVDSKPARTIVREQSTANFASAIGFVNAVAILAEAMDHHPDILIYGWNKVRITLSTHDQGGLTELDIQLAKKIEGISLSLSL
jgi:4a-hydroxytetrahydrobiopterin dehydratase